MEIVNHDPQFRYSWCSQTILRLKKVQFTRTIHKIAPCQKKMKGGEERGKDYNHSTFCDLLISELLGLPPRADNIIEVQSTPAIGCMELFLPTEKLQRVLASLDPASIIL